MEVLNEQTHLQISVLFELVACMYGELVLRMSSKTVKPVVRIAINVVFIKILKAVLF